MELFSLLTKFCRVKSDLLSGKPETGYTSPTGCRTCEESGLCGSRYLYYTLSDIIITDITCTLEGLA